MSTEGKGSVSIWIDALKNPDENMNPAAQQLWDRYFGELVSQARARLRKIPRLARDEAANDEEDIALSAFGSLWAGVAQGRFTQLDHRDDLGRLLATILKRKVCAHLRKSHAGKRGGGKAQHDFAIESMIEQGPTPDVVALANVEVQRLLNLLRDETLRKIALLRMEGYHNEEVGKSIGCNVRTVERKLELIRKTWRGEVDEDD
jgi:DNA-directed RNA polymerase specialized sigma24 family protein